MATEKNTAQEEQKLAAQKNLDVKMITTKTGKQLTVRKDRRRYFFPDEWNNFIATFDEGSKHYVLYTTLINTGARIMEALHIKARSFDFERSTIKLEIVKHRAANKKLFASGQSRTFFISDKYSKIAKAYIKDNKLQDNDYLFLDNSKLPTNYFDLPNNEKAKYYKKTVINYGIVLKRHLKQAGIQDPWNFSLHNLRKTYGMYMRALNKDFNDMCYRLGHDMNTYLKHYGSSLIFNESDKIKIIKIMGDIK